MPSEAIALSRLLDRSFWTDLAPAMHVEDLALVQAVTPFEIDAASAEATRTLLRTEGYLQIPPPDWRLPIRDMAGAVATLERRGLPVPFAFVYDEFWCLFFRLNKILEQVLGAGFHRLPDFWAWLIDPRRDDRGWKPHRDRNWRTLFPDGSPKSVTIWIPLTDSTTLNGCMYIVPADRDPVYGTADDTQYRFEYADVRALPAPAGTIFCWNQAVLHWGSHASPRDAAPRIAVAFEFQSAQVEPYNQPLMNPYTIPAFGFRMQLIAKQILQYAHMYPLPRDIERLAATLVTSPAQPAG